jgi:triosephosphate isomerase
MRPEDIREMSIFVKKIFADMFGPDAGLKVRVLYGGSVNYRNAPDIMFVGKVDGLLVGRESVNAPGFVALLKAVDAVCRS